MYQWTLRLAISLLLAGSGAAPASGQDADVILQRWSDAQTEAAVTVVRILMGERVTYDLEGAFGPRHMNIHSDLELDRPASSARRTILDVRVGDRQLDLTDRRRRRFDHPVRGDMMRAADELLFPLPLARSMRTTSQFEEERVEGRDLIKIRTIHDDEGAPVEVVTWWFDREGTRLVRTRSIVKGGDRGTMVVDVRYRQINGVDLPVDRRMEGSFGVRRRTRSYTVLLRGQSVFEGHRMEMP